MRKLLIFAIVFVFAYKVQPNELSQLKKLSELNRERAKIVMEKMNELFREQPELKMYVSQPSTRNILQKIRAKKGDRGGVDTVRVLAIRVEFQEHPKDSLATGTGKIRTWRDSMTTVTTEGDTVVAPVPPFDSLGYHNLDYDPPHTKRYFEHQLEALRNYWLDNSCGKLYIDFTVAPQAESAAYQLPYQIYYYGDPSNYVQGLLTLLRDALLACDQDTFKMSNYDAYIIFHAGCSWQAQASLGGATPYDILSAYIRGLDWYFGTPVYVDNGTHPITDGIIVPESDFKYGVPAFLQGGLAHEFGHQLGLFDLYDTSGETIGCGKWALMGTGNWNMNGLLPPHVSAWHAERLGWVRLEEIDRSMDNVDVYYMGGNDITKTKIYKIHINSNEYFLITNRQVWANPDTTRYVEIYSTDSTLHYDSSAVRVWKDGVLTRFDDYDFGLPPDPTDTANPTYGGLAIWHIDKSKIAKDSLQNAINAGLPKGVDMEEADGVQDFETPWWLLSSWKFAQGSPWDVFFDGSAASFTPYTLPNTDDNNGAVSHMYIYSISKSDTIMTFSIRFDWLYSNFPIKPGHIFDVNSPTIVEVDDEKLIVCSVMDTINGGSVFVCKADGTILWQNPVRDTIGNTIFGAAIYSSPAIGDINGNDTLDVVCGAYFARWRERPPSRFYPATDSVIEAWGRVYAWDIYGEGIKGFPVKVNNAIIASPLLADIDGDDAKEIIIGSNDMMLHIWRGDGTPITAIDLSQWIWTTPVYDSSSNVIYANSFDGRLFAVKSNGDTLWIAMEPSLSYTTSSPVVGDIDGDSRNEIIVTTGVGKVVCVDDSGKIKWSIALKDTPFYSSPALADIDKDSYLDIILAAGNKIYALNHNGTYLPGFPINTGAKEAFQSSPVIGDVDDDGNPEIIVSSPDGKLLVYQNDGKAKPGFPLSMAGKTYSTPALADLDNDGDIEIVVGCDDGKLYVWSLPQSYGELHWPMLHKGETNNGIYTMAIEHPQVPDDIFLKSDFYVYPNPVSRDGGKIRYFSGKADNVNIKIINVAGDIIKEFDGKIGENAPEDVDLPLSDMASGLYLCRIEVVKDGKRMIRFKKFTVIK